MMQDDIHDWALHAYVDNELFPEQRAEVEALMARRPTMARRVGDWRRQREMLKDAYASSLHEPVPQHLTAMLESTHRPRLRSFAAIAAAIMLVLLGGMAGWFLRSDMPSAPNMGAEALAAHRLYALDTAHAVDVAADDKAALQAWLTRRVGLSFHLPDLTREGYSLLGGRLLPGDNGATALLMYESATGQRISVLLALSPKDQDSALAISFKEKFTVCSWRDGKMAVAVTGELTRDPMMRLATSIYEQLEG